MKAAVDLHIHSCLSPCADDDMTPNNIVNMALLKKLDIISVTDHNSGGNVAAVMEVAKDKDILVLPGMEVNSREEVHLLCYFESLDCITAFDRFLYPHIPEVPNNKNIFGSQLFCSEQDEIIGEEKKLLINAVDLSINEIVYHVEAMGGVVIPAHADKSSNSIISNLGFIPDDLHFNFIEISCSIDHLPKIFEKYSYIHSSDAHQLGSISEPVHFLNINEISLPAIMHLLKNSPN